MTEYSQSPSAVKIRRVREERRLKGLCMDCTNPVAAPGMSRCERHLRGNIRAVRKYNAKCVEEGRCNRCGRPLVGVETGEQCQYCLDKNWQGRFLRNHIL